jgi:hypothetical protein
VQEIGVFVVSVRLEEDEEPCDPAVYDRDD